MGPARIYDYFDKYNITADLLQSSDTPDDRFQAKTLIWELEEGSPAALVLPLHRKVCTRQLHVLFHSHVRMVSREEATRISGYEIGTIPPCGHATEMPIYIDRTVVDESPGVIYGGAGRENLEMRVAVSELLKLPHVNVLNFTSLEQSDCLVPSSSTSRLSNSVSTSNPAFHSDCPAPSVVKTLSALHKLVMKPSPDVAHIVEKSLQISGIDPTAVLSSGKNLLHMAAWRGSRETVDVLLSSGCDINSFSTGEGNYGKTALFYALTRSRDDIVCFLLQKGAKVCIVNNKGQTPITLAYSHCSLAVQRHLDECEVRELSRGDGWWNFYASHWDGRHYGDTDPRFVGENAPVGATLMPELVPEGEFENELPLCRLYRVIQVDTSSSCGITIGQRISLPRSSQRTTVESRQKKFKPKPNPATTLSKSRPKKSKSIVSKTECNTQSSLRITGSLSSWRACKNGDIVSKVTTSTSRTLSSPGGDMLTIPLSHLCVSPHEHGDVSGESAAVYVEVVIDCSTDIFVNNVSSSTCSENIYAGQRTQVCTVDIFNAKRNMVGCDIAVTGRVVEHCRLRQHVPGNLSSLDSYFWRLMIRAITVDISSEMGTENTQRCRTDESHPETSAVQLLSCVLPFRRPVPVPSTPFPWFDDCSPHCTVLCIEDVFSCTECATSRKGETVVFVDDMVGLRRMKEELYSELNKSHICFPYECRAFDRYMTLLSEHMDVALSSIHENSSTKRGMIVGLDAEWRPDQDGYSSPVSILQISTRVAVFIVDLLALCGKPESEIELEDSNTSISNESRYLNHILTDFFADDDVLVLGYGLETDIRRVVMSYPFMSAFHSIGNAFDLQDHASERLHSDRKLNRVGMRIGLSNLVMRTLGLCLDKSEQLSDWQCRPLTNNQLEYAALDAAVLPLLFDILLSYHENNM